MSFISYIPASFRDHFVFVLDDDPRVCETLSTVFRLEGFQAAFGTSIEEFQAAAGSIVPPTVVIANPGVAEDQFSFLRSLRSLSRRATLFILQDAADVDAAVFAMQAGAHGVLVRPIDYGRLIHTVRSALATNIEASPAFGEAGQFLQQDLGALRPSSQDGSSKPT
jgi:two-component system response regulator FixJ